MPLMATETSATYTMENDNYIIFDLYTRTPPLMSCGNRYKNLRKLVLIKNIYQKRSTSVSYYEEWRWVFKILFQTELPFYYT